MRQFDVVHVHLFPAQLWAALGGARLSKPVPLLTTEHGSSNYRRRWWLRAFDGWLYRQYTWILCNSEATAKSLIQWCPSTAPKVSVVHNGIPLDDFETAQPAELAVPSGVARLVVLGRFDPPEGPRNRLACLGHHTASSSSSGW